MQELLARAYNQEHYTLAEAETFLAEIEPSIGAGDLLALHKLMINKYGMPRLGTTRVTYISKVVGFKVPIAADGFRLNEQEDDLLHAAGGFQLGKTRMAHPLGIPVLAMEIIHRATPAEVEKRIGEVPNWAEAIDMFQVGFNNKGIIKAFDYAELMTR